MKGLPTSVSLLLTNLRLLDFDFDAFPVTDDAFGQSSANKSKTFEHIIYHLYHTFDPEECELVCTCTSGCRRTAFRFEAPARLSF